MTDSSWLQVCVNLQFWFLIVFQRNVTESWSRGSTENVSQTTPRLTASLCTPWVTQVTLSHLQERSGAGWLTLSLRKTLSAQCKNVLHSSMLLISGSNFPWSPAGKLVVLVLVEELGSSDEGLRWVSVQCASEIWRCVLAHFSFIFRLKGLLEKVAADYRETYSRSESSQTHWSTPCRLKTICLSIWLNV